MEIIIKEWVTVIVTSIAPLITIIGFFVSFRINRRSMEQILDGSSEWRKSLFRACSKKEIDMSDIHLLRTCLRYVKYKKNTKEYSFNWFSNESIRFCNSLIAQSYLKKEIELKCEEQEIVRSIIRCLLKNHWEYRSRFYNRKDRHNAKKNIVVEDTTKYIRQFTKDYFGSENKKTDTNKKDKISGFLGKLERPLEK